MNTNAKIVLGVVILIAIAGSAAIVRSNAERQRVADREKQDKLELAAQREEDLRARAELEQNLQASQSSFDQAAKLIAAIEKSLENKGGHLSPDLRERWNVNNAERRTNLAELRVTYDEAEAMLKADKAALAKWDAEHPQP